MSTSKRLQGGFLFVLLTAAFALGGCVRKEHIRADYGKSVKEAFALQASATKRSAEPAHGLDSEEASLIHSNYRRVLGDRTSTRAQQGPAEVLIVKPDSGKKRSQDQ